MVKSDNNSVENRAETITRLLETKIYKIERNTLSGFFPVFVVDLDFSVILDSTTETAITRYIADTPIIGMIPRPRFVLDRECQVTVYF